MRQEQAERFANVLIGVAVAGAAYYVLREPSRRRVAWDLVRHAAGGTVPGWLIAEALRAWNAAAPEGPRQAAL
jgi:hypothetical protein